MVDKRSVSMFGPSISQSAAGAEAAERLALREQAKKVKREKTATRKVEDEVDLELTGADGVGAVRKLAGNDSEDATLDHRRQGGKPPAKPDKPSLDVEG